MYGVLRSRDGKEVSGMVAVRFPRVFLLDLTDCMCVYVKA